MLGLGYIVILQTRLCPDPLYAALHKHKAFFAVKKKKLILNSECIQNTQTKGHHMC